MSDLNSTTSSTTITETNKCNRPYYKPSTPGQGEGEGGGGVCGVGMLTTRSSALQHHLLQLLVDLLEHGVRLEALESIAGAGQHCVDPPPGGGGTVTGERATTQGRSESGGWEWGKGTEHCSRVV